MYLSIDTESAGIGGSLLQVGLALFDSQGKEMGAKLFNVKPTDNMYVVNPQGLKINHIDLVRHDDIATPYSLAKTDLYRTLDGFHQLCGQRLYIMGHGATKDIQLIGKCLLTENSIYNFCHYSPIELSTMVYMNYQKKYGYVPKDVDTSLETVAGALNIPVDKSQIHTALYDARLTAQLIFTFFS